MRLSHQKAVGTTTRFNFSVAYHWTKKREKNTAFPSQPTASHTAAGTPKSLPLCHTRVGSQSISGVFSIHRAVRTWMLEKNSEHGRLNTEYFAPTPTQFPRHRSAP